MNTTDASQPNDVLERLLRIGLGVGAVMSLAVGIWMLASPRDWFEVFPAGIEDFGPFNQHFIRDVGAWYTAGGILLAFGSSNPIRFGGMTIVVTSVAYVLHAWIHISDLVSGRVHARHWIIDLPLVFLPVLIFLLLLWIWWTLVSGKPPDGRPEPPADEGRL